MKPLSALVLILCSLGPAWAQPFAAPQPSAPQSSEALPTEEEAKLRIGLDGNCLMKPFGVSVSPYKEAPRPPPPKMGFGDYQGGVGNDYRLRSKKALGWRGTARGHRFVVVKKFDMRAGLSEPVGRK